MTAKLLGWKCDGLKRQVVPHTWVFGLGVAHYGAECSGLFRPAVTVFKLHFGSRCLQFSKE